MGFASFLFGVACAVPVTLMFAGHPAPPLWASVPYGFLLAVLIVLAELEVRR